MLNLVPIIKGQHINQWWATGNMGIISADQLRHQNIREATRAADPTFYYEHCRPPAPTSSVNKRYISNIHNKQKLVAY
jgi:hypothetical protein